MPSPVASAKRLFKIAGMALGGLAGLWMAAAQAQTLAPGFSPPIDPAAEVATYRIELRDGELLPPVLVVPAKTRFKLHVVNIGTKPSEFESNQMRLEEVLFMGMDTTLTVTPLDPGEYDYFDEFQPGVMGKLTAQEVAP